MYVGSCKELILEGKHFLAGGLSKILYVYSFYMYILHFSMYKESLKEAAFTLLISTIGICFARIIISEPIERKFSSLFHLRR
jgi:hypothetical protein